MSDLEARATRLGVSILLRGIVFEQRSAREAMEATHEARLVTRDDWDEWCEGDDEDIHIGVACLRVEYELRQAQWAALEFPGLVNGGGATPSTVSNTPQSSPGRRHIAKPGEPACPAPGCERPAGLFTHHQGRGFCRRHDRAPAPTGPLARRLREPAEATPDPAPIVRLLLTSAKRAGYPFEDAWGAGYRGCSGAPSRRSRPRPA